MKSEPFNLTITIKKPLEKKQLKCFRDTIGIKIDKLVYELHGLSEEKIKIMEGK